jgi:anaerobic selenocysteine-containing dehydrogenase
MTEVTRRDFLKISAAGAATAILAGCSTTDQEHWVKLEPYVNMPEEQVAGVPNWYASTCRMCPAGCGIIARVMNGRATKLEGNPLHPVNRGKLCARGQAGLQLLYNPDRITGAVRHERGSQDFDPIPWNEGINTLIEQVQAAGGNIAVWLGSTTSAHLYDLFHRFTDAVGAPTPVVYDLYSSVNGFAAVRALNGDWFDRAELPTYDLGNADTIFSFGADFTGTWHSSNAYNVEYGNFRSQNYGQRGYFVHFEPRMSNTAAGADRWVPIRPGSEALVAQAIARVMADEGVGGDDRVERARALAGDVDLEEAAEACEMSVEDLTQLARVFANAARPVALPGGYLTGREDAADAVAAVQALNVIVGNVGQVGGMSITPALPTDQLVSPPISSLSDIQDLIERLSGGDVQLLLVHGANPLYELSPALGLREALENVPFVVSFNSMVDETTLYADLVLPDRVYLEGWGYHVASPSFQGLPVVSSQQPVVPPLYDNLATADVLLTVAQRIEGAAQALPWADEVEFMQSVLANLPAGAMISDDPVTQWVRYRQFGGWWPAEAPAAELPEAAVSEPLSANLPHFDGDEDEYPYFFQPYLSLLLGDGSGANLPWLQGSPDPLTTISWQTWVEINPKTAHEIGVENGDVVKVKSNYGEVEALVYVYPAIRPDTIAMPFGQGHDVYGRYANGRGSNPVQLFGPDGNWAILRVQIEKSDENRHLAVFESTIETEDAHMPFGIESSHSHEE